MAEKLLIDANHPEEIRVAVVKGQTLEDFDSEIATKKPIKGNVYLAKVIKVEPSLQAAFVEFGGNRHGFLPFSEIHPDYYRIPIADRPENQNEEVNFSSSSQAAEETLEATNLDTALRSENFPPQTYEDELLPVEQLGIQSEDSAAAVSPSDPEEKDSLSEIMPPKPFSYKYKIQEVIKRRHILLVQVVKEERGNKGAALTTYLSLPGRYCVLMPNAGYRAGGVSRKISDGEDRRRLKDLIQDLSIPEGMALIVRTAGQERNKIEIKRDYDYLLRLWSEIRDLTLKSIAPSLIYAEGDLIKRAIRDLYNRHIDEVLVEGEEAYKQAKGFMKQLIPSHARKVKLYRDDTYRLFEKFKVEAQISEMMDPTVKLPSGGSIVINPTEALVAIDVNSGRSTRERHIDETALKTNLEAANEVARQMRLRDLGGIIVVDFIDMNENNHTQQVEKRLREAVKEDRARIQVGKISQFGLMELSRQRLRPSLIETYTTPCGHCQGTGLIRSIESVSLQILRDIETNALQKSLNKITVGVPAQIDLYLLNQKRQHLVTLESRFNLVIQVNRDEALTAPHYKLDFLSEQEEDFKKVDSAEKHRSPGMSTESSPQERERPTALRQKQPERTAPDKNSSDRNSIDTPSLEKISLEKTPPHRHQRRRRPQASQNQAPSPLQAERHKGLPEKEQEDLSRALEKSSDSVKETDEASKGTLESKPSRRSSFRRRRRRTDANTSSSTPLTTEPSGNAGIGFTSMPDTERVPSNGEFSPRSLQKPSRNPVERENLKRDELKKSATPDGHDSSKNKPPSQERNKSWLRRLLDS